MSIKRNKTLSKKVLERDLYTCCCCGLEASHAHHITPLYKGGEDIIENMVALCDTDHYYAPDSKEDFEIYVKNGGAKLDFLMGRAINYYLKNKEELKDYNLEKIVNIANDTINVLKETHKIWIKEKYGE